MRSERLILETLAWLVGRQVGCADEAFRYLRRIRTALEELEKLEAELDPFEQMARLGKKEH
jgi:hypothetical protein